VVDATGTLVLEPGWSALRLSGGELLLERLPTAPQGSAAAPRATAAAAPTAAPDPVALELYNHRFTAIAEQMGVRLQQSARSVNIRERLDFSCALFDGDGQLVANAPHIPVHLGSMGESVRGLLDAVARRVLPPPGPGDAIAANDPFHGGTHLPDITVITPVFAAAAAGGSPLFYVACRGHHADVGGLTPGSMPPFSRSLAEEGLLLDNVPLLVGGVLQREEWRRLRSCWPTSRPRSPPTGSGWRSCNGWWSATARRRCAPTWPTGRPTPPRRCGARSAACVTASTRWSSMTGL
jgi:5-oxoprolinase (ATP-hydrolysing)